MLLFWKKLIIKHTFLFLFFFCTGIQQGPQTCMKTLIINYLAKHGEISESHGSVASIVKLKSFRIHIAENCGGSVECQKLREN
jgi:hypothetical protein